MMWRVSFLCLLRMKILSLILLSFAAFGDTLPGFRVETVATLDGFVSSVVTASDGTIYVTTTDGWIHRIEPGQTNPQATPVAALPTHADSNSGLLGMALIDDSTAVVHYTLWGTDTLVFDDVVSRVDLATGAETVMHAFVCDPELRSHGVSPEHHGGNPIVASDGSVFLGIGDYGGNTVSQREGWNGGRVWRIAPSGSVTQWAQGLRNPYDLAWDPELASIVVSDNGPKRGDELNIVIEGSNCGWPATFGNEPSHDGMIAPDYVFEQTVAPTGLARLDGANSMLRTGYLLGAFVTRSVYYFPSLTVEPIPDPIAIVSGFDEFIIDVTQSAAGAIYIASASFPASSTVSRLVPPARGDCDGNGLVDVRDLLALYEERGDGEAQPTVGAQDGAYAGSWGCDTNTDGLIDWRDIEALRVLIGARRRAVGSR